MKASKFSGVQKELGLKRKVPRKRRSPDPLADVFDAEIVPLLKAAHGIWPIAVFEEMLLTLPPISPL